MIFLEYVTSYPSLLKSVNNFPHTKFRTCVISRFGKVSRLKFEAGYKGSYGYLVILKHSNGFTTYYSHCSEILVKEGQNIAKNQKIAKVGRTGNCTGPHVHFEIRDTNNTPINPELNITIFE